MSRLLLRGVAVCLALQALQACVPVKYYTDSQEMQIDAGGLRREEMHRFDLTLGETQPRWMGTSDSMDLRTGQTLRTISYGKRGASEPALRNGFYPVNGREWSEHTCGKNQTLAKYCYQLEVLADCPAEDWSGSLLAEVLQRRRAVLLAKNDTTSSQLELDVLTDTLSGIAATTTTTDRSTCKTAGSFEFETAVEPREFEHDAQLSVAVSHAFHYLEDELHWPIHSLTVRHWVIEVLIRPRFSSWLSPAAWSRFSYSE